MTLEERIEAAEGVYRAMRLEAAALRISPVYAERFMSKETGRIMRDEYEAYLRAMIEAAECAQCDGLPPSAPF